MVLRICYIDEDSVRFTETDPTFCTDTEFNTVHYTADGL